MHVWGQAEASFPHFSSGRQGRVLPVGTHCLPDPAPAPPPLQPPKAPHPCHSGPGQVLESRHKGAGDEGDHSARFICWNCGAVEQRFRDPRAGPRSGSVPPLAHVVLLAAGRPVFLIGAPRGGPGLPLPMLGVSGLSRPCPMAPFARLPASV